MGFNKMGFHRSMELEHLDIPLNQISDKAASQLLILL